MAGYDSRHRLIAIADQHLFTIPHNLNMGAQPRLQIADIYGSHGTIIADVTMLVIFYLGGILILR